MVSGFLFNCLFEYLIVKFVFNELYYFLLKVLDCCFVLNLMLNVDKVDV